VAHARREQLKRQKASLRHYPPQTPESVLTGLSHYAPAEPKTAAATAAAVSDPNRPNSTTSEKWDSSDTIEGSLNPFG